MTNIQDDIQIRHGTGERPIYQQIAEAIEARIQNGRLGPGGRLPTLRELAAQLDVNVATITSAYGVLERRGLIESTPGRGTFVRSGGERLTPETGRPLSSSFIDLTVNRPATGDYVEALAATLPRLAKDARLEQLRDYAPAEGTAWGREAGAAWIGHSGLDVGADEVIVTSGTQHALLAALSAIVQPGDVVLSSELTYYGLRALARLLHFHAEPVAADDAGLLPEALAEHCRDPRVRAIFVVPCMDNPTTVTMPEHRRCRIAEIAHSAGVFLIEDDVYGPLLTQRPPPLASIYREGTFYITGTSKTLAPGLRIGFVSPPRPYLPGVAEGVCTTEWMTQPLTVLLFSAWMKDGTALALVERQRQTLTARFEAARHILQGQDYAGAPGCPHLWLRLPPPWRAQEFTDTAGTNGVGVLPAEAFMIGRSQAPHAVRINLGAATSTEKLEEGLNRLMETLTKQPRPVHRLA